ncbi:hypothetical protein CRG98_041301 [Punica granatum]|uniref:Uncharacterized protein n=1 Tax=Punica granatum TaxID=22663 RepID=A0A2I0I4D3_PUNGR|nr:hypothetical protein CRG98_041301 [Punica granatum]
MRFKKLNSHGLADPTMLQEERARWLGELAVIESKVARVSRPVKTRQGCKRHGRGGAANLPWKKVISHWLADPTRLQEAQARWLGELAVQERRLARVSKPGKVARGTSEESKLARVSRPRQGCKKHERRGSADLRCRKANSHGLADPARHERGGSANLRCKKVNSHWLADPARLPEAQARCLCELKVQENKLARVSRPGKVARSTSEVARRTCGARKETLTGKQTRQGCKRHERGGSANLRCRKVGSHGLANSARLQQARARWFRELAVQESKQARVSRLGKTRQGCKRHERGGSANLRCRKVSSHGLADPARLHEARASRLGELAVQEIKLARVSRPSNVARGTSEVARRTCSDGKKEGSHGLANSARSQHARARWLGELAVLESKLTRVGRPGKGARGTKETWQRCKRHEGGGSVNLQCRKVSWHGLADRARLQEPGARWLGELAVHEIKHARVSRPGKVGRGTSVVARRTCGGGKKVSSHELANPARLQQARARWFRELAVQESKQARVSRLGKTQQSCKRHERGGSANLRCRKVCSHGLADPAKLQEARARWLGELAVQESMLARVSRPSKVARGTSEVARRTCGAGKKVCSHGLADPAKLQEARARWLGELPVQESNVSLVSRPDKVARGTSEVALRT